MSTKGLDNKFESYVYAITEQIEQHISGLNELREILMLRSLTFNERSATERSLQVLVESAIGCSKHYLKSIQKPVPSEARNTIERVYENLAIEDININEMRGAIGMRNAIIHDYLNLDWKKLEEILMSNQYRKVEQFTKIVLQALLK